MLKFPRKEGKRKKKRKEGERREIKEGRKGTEERKGKGTEWAGILIKKRKVCKKK